MPEVTLLLVMGLPGAGKTSLCEQLPHRLTDWKVEHVAFDSEINESIFKDLQEGSWKDERSRVVQKVRSRCIDLRSASGPSHLVLLDDNFYFRSMRHAFLQVAKDAGCSLALLHMAPSLDRCLQRDAARPRPVGAAVIRKMATRFEPLSPENVWWEECSLVLREESIDWASVVALVERSRRHRMSREVEAAAEAEAEAARAVCRASFRHQADLMLRAEFKRRVEGAGDLARPEGKQLVARLRNARTEVMADIRSGALQPPPHLDLTSGDCACLQEMLSTAFDSALAS